MSFKSAKVVMLPTNNKSTIFLSDDKTSISRTQQGNISNNAVHLYILSDDEILSDEEIKEGDWCIDTRLDKSNHLIRWNKQDEEDGFFFSAKKIIAATDKHLLLHDNNINNKCFGTQLSGKCTHTLPQISQQFIEKYIEEYNKGNVIIDVMVEYEEVMKIKTFPNGMLEKSERTKELELKVNPKDNTITIKKIKDSWNRNEVVELIQKLEKDGADYFGQDFLEIWIKDNL